MASVSTLLEKIELAIEARLSGRQVESYSINGRNIAFTPLSELRAMRKELKRENANISGGRNYVKFSSPK